MRSSNPPSKVFARSSTLAAASSALNSSGAFAKASLQSMVRVGGALALKVCRALLALNQL